MTTKAEPMTLQKLAEETSAKFEQARRGDGGDFYWRVKAEHTDTRPGHEPNWVQKLCYDAHGDKLPDDYVYSFVLDALYAIAEADDVDEIHLEADIYTNALTSWLASRNDRLEYVDLASETAPGIRAFDLLAGAQVMEREEVLDSVRASLEAHLEELEADE